MPLFEFDEGRLVPAQFGRPVLETVEPEVLQAVREQVLEVVAEPLFPVSWHDDDARPRLTAMDPSGQVVTVEVTERLDAASLVAALSRAGRMAERGWLELAETYPSGVAAFRRDWSTFRETMPPHPAPGPRLVVVAAVVDDEIRPALTSLAGNGVRVHEVSVRQMSNGRRFLDVTEVRAGLANHPAVLPGRASRRPELSQAIPGENSFPGRAVVPVPELDHGDAPGWNEVDGEREPGGAASPTPPAARASEPVVPTAAQAAASAVAQAAALPELRAIAAALDGPTGLVWTRGPGVRFEATLLEDGQIVAGGVPCSTPEAAAAAVSGDGDVDGWDAWRFGADGPTLAESRAELAALAAQAPERPAPASQDGQGLTRRERRRRGSTA